MSRAVTSARVGAKGVDTVTAITNSAIAANLKAAGVDFLVRYLGKLSNPEVDLILAAGLALMPVTYSRKPGWLPNGNTGHLDGQAAAANCNLAGIPRGATVWLDLEGPGGHAQDAIDWVDAWASEVKGAGFDPGLYVGYGALLTSDELWKLGVDRYWKSMSRVTDSSGALAEPKCGYCMYQLHPSVNVAGVFVDVDFIQEDYLGRVPNWVVRGA